MQEEGERGVVSTQGPGLRRRSALVTGCVAETYAVSLHVTI
jgi:hypothetical protein